MSFKISWFRVSLLVLPGVAVWTAIAPGNAEIRELKPTPPKPGMVVGPSVLMNARQAGQIQVIDLRPHGRQVPEAINPDQWKSAPLETEVFLLGDASRCRTWAKSRGLKQYAIVPTNMIEVHAMTGVPQISPQRAAERVRNQSWPLYDISEDVEFAGSRLPGSRRLDYAAFQNGLRNSLDKKRPLLIACRVGHRSQLVVQQLRREGYQAYNVEGGLWQWECDGLPVEKADE